MKSKLSHAVLDIGSRQKKARMIIGILKNYKNIKNSKVLDIGTGSGVIAHEIGKIAGNVYSVDIRDERVLKGGYIFKKIKNEGLPFKNSEFDIVISNHVMAHVKNDELHLKEIRRVLKSDGFAYLSMLNRLWFLEPNFNLLFLSWVPKRIADFYVRLAGKGRHYDVHPLGYCAFLEKIGKHFDYEDITIKVINQKVSMPDYAYRLLKLFSPVWVFVLKKRR
mgnify:CR=1 FL=1